MAGSGSPMLYAGASAGLDLLGGLFGYFASQEAAQIAESRGRMLLMEAEEDAQRYAEQARGVRAQTKLAFLKNGVALTGSPLDVLDHDARVAEENISAIRARGRAGALDADSQALQVRLAGRSALLSGLTSGAGKLAWGSYQSGKNKLDAAGIEKDMAFRWGSMTSPGYSGGWGSDSGAGARGVA